MFQKSGKVRFRNSVRPDWPAPGPIKLRVVFPLTSVLSKPPQLPHGAKYFVLDQFFVFDFFFDMGGRAPSPPPPRRRRGTAAAVGTALLQRRRRHGGGGGGGAFAAQAAQAAAAPPWRRLRRGTCGEEPPQTPRRQIMHRSPIENRWIIHRRRIDNRWIIDK